MNISIVDVHGLKGAQRDGIEYVGRAGRWHTWLKSPLANPFRRNGKTDDRPLRMYTEYLKNQYNANRFLYFDNETIRLELRRLQRKAMTGPLVLGCWCVNDPNPLGHDATVCHAQIIARFLAREGLL